MASGSHSSAVGRVFFRSPHSQITMTFHPISFSSGTFLLSLAKLSANLTAHFSALFFGNVALGHATCWCQKHPWTNIAIRYFGSTMSGHPGSARSCSLYRKPRACRNKRTIISGRVFLARMPAIILDRVLESTMSIFGSILAKTTPNRFSFF